MALSEKEHNDFLKILEQHLNDYRAYIDSPSTDQSYSSLMEIALKVRTLFESYEISSFVGSSKNTDFLFIINVFNTYYAYPDIPIMELKEFWKDFSKSVLMMNQYLQESGWEPPQADSEIVSYTSVFRDFFAQARITFFLGAIQEENISYILYTQDGLFLHQSTHAILEHLISTEDITFLNALPPIKNPPHDS